MGRSSPRTQSCRAAGRVLHGADPQPAYARGLRCGRDAVLRLVRQARAREPLLEIDIALVAQELVELLLIGAMRSLDLAVELRRARFDVDVTDPLVGHIPVEQGLELVAAVRLFSLAAGRGCTTRTGSAGRSGVGLWPEPVRFSAAENAVHARRVGRTTSRTSKETLLVRTISRAFDSFRQQLAPPVNELLRRKLCLRSAHPVLLLGKFTHRLPKHAVPFRLKFTRGHFRKNARIVKCCAQPVTWSTRLNVEALVANDSVHDPAVLSDVQLKVYQAPTRFCERQEQGDGARVEEPVGSSPRHIDISLAPHVAVSVDHVLNVWAFGRVENEERNHPPVPNVHSGDTRVSHDRDGFGLGRMLNRNCLPMPFIFQRAAPEGGDIPSGISYRTCR